jgi:hypothetical protein
MDFAGLLRKKVAKRREVRLAADVLDLLVVSVEAVQGRMAVHHGRDFTATPGTERRDVPDDAGNACGKPLGLCRNFADARARRI